MKSRGGVNRKRRFPTDRCYPHAFVVQVSHEALVQDFARAVVIRLVEVIALPLAISVGVYLWKVRIPTADADSPRPEVSMEGSII